MHKKGEKTVMGNQRPIAILSKFLKLFEYCVSIGLESFLNTSNAITASQYDSRKHRSTKDAQYEFLEKCSTLINHKQPVVGIFLNQFKAFDMVNHKLLLTILEKFVISGAGHSWFCSYLRRQYIEMRKPNKSTYCRSDILNITCGVPQWSVLVSVFFTLFINDLPDNIANANSFLYSVDINILIPSREDTHQEQDKLLIS